jgi:hypothetical protein
MYMVLDKEEQDIRSIRGLNLVAVRVMTVQQTNTAVSEYVVAYVKL